MSISTWYLTNAYATLTLRSTISVEIIEAFNEAEDIQIAYPTQTLYLNNKENRIPELPMPESGETKVEW